MEALNRQVKTLKINVTRINSYLSSSNKTLKKLKVDKQTFIKTTEDQQKKQQKEKKIETPATALGSFGKKVLGKIMSGPMSIFDKIKEFFGILILGLIINNLPAMIDAIKGFFDRNRWIGDGLKLVLKGITYGLQGLIDLVGKFSSSKQNKIKKETDELHDTFKSLDGELDKSQRDVENELKNAGKNDKDNKNQEKRSVDEIARRQESRQSTPSPSTANSGSTSPAPQAPKKSEEAPKYAKGGEVPKQKTTSTTKTTESKTTSSGKVSTSRGSSTEAKRARRSINSFQFFDNNMADSKDAVDTETKNNEMFKEILVSLRSIEKIRSEIKDEEGISPDGNDGGGDGGGGGGGGGGSFSGSAADIPPEGKALLDAIAGSESRGYNSRYPSKTFDNGYKDHPRIRERILSGPNRGKTSNAAGRYQFLSTTWDQYKPGKAFTPENQDIAAYRLAIAAYGYGERGLIKALQKDPLKVANKLSGTWTSLPGGIEKNNATNGFLSRYNASVKRYKDETKALEAKGIKKFSRSDITSFFGQQESFRKKPHEGMDIAANQGTPISFGMGGKIIGVYRTNSRDREANGGYGSFMDIQFSDGRIARMAHLSQIPTWVKRNGSFRANEIIAYSGGQEGAPGSGRSGGPHIHLEQLSRPMGTQETTKGKFDPLQGGIFNLIQEGGVRRQQLSANPQQRNLRASSQTGGQLVAVQPIVVNNTRYQPVPIPIA